MDGRMVVRRKEAHEPLSKRSPPVREFSVSPMEEGVLGKVSRAASTIGKTCRRMAHGFKDDDKTRTPVPPEVAISTFSEIGVIAASKKVA
jgi:hypothetical protein